MAKMTGVALLQAPLVVAVVTLVLVLHILPTAVMFRLFQRVQLRETTATKVSEVHQVATVLAVEATLTMMLCRHPAVVQLTTPTSHTLLIWLIRLRQPMEVLLNLKLPTLLPLHHLQTKLLLLTVPKMLMLLLHPLLLASPIPRPLKPPLYLIPTMLRHPALL